MSLQGKRIFIVEDNFQNRIVFLTILKMHGVWMEFDRWGTETLWRLRSFKQVDLIILDLMLTAGISGYDVFDQIRGLPGYGQTPIIAVSAADPVIAIPKTQQKGFAGFIAKPIDDELFPKQLAQVIAGEPVWYAGERYHGIGD
jgi:CheY-like chemotaxis protein